MTDVKREVIKMLSDDTLYKTSLVITKEGEPDTQVGKRMLEMIREEMRSRFFSIDKFCFWGDLFNGCAGDLETTFDPYCFELDGDVWMVHACAHHLKERANEV